MDIFIQYFLMVAVSSLRFQMHFLSIKISLKFALKGSINNIPALVQIMASARRQAIIWTNDGIVYWRIYASLSFNGLKIFFINFITEVVDYYCICHLMMMWQNTWKRHKLTWKWHQLTHLPPSAIYLCQWIRSALFQTTACLLFAAKPSSKPMLGYCQLDP